MKTTLPQLIGVIHLPPLAGAPGASRLHPSEALNRAGALAVKEAVILAKAGFDGIIIENFGDVPFYKDQVPAETIASMAVIVAAVRESVKVKIGVNILRNDAKAALAVAAVTGADFIRVNVISGVAATDQGIIQGCAAELMRERIRLQCENVGVMADVLVKHAQTLSETDLTFAIEEAALRAGADGVIITGASTGRAPDQERFTQAVKACRHIKTPLYVGSGATIETLQEWATTGMTPTGVIVGSALRAGGKAGAKLEPKRVVAFAKQWKKKRRA